MQKLELPSSAANDGARPSGLDPAALQVLRELDPTGQGGLVARILDTYLQSLGRLETEFNTAHATGDWAVIAHVAHTLKSSSASIGAMDFSRRCSDLEKDIRQGRTAGLAAQLQGFQAGISQTRAAVQQHQEQPQ